MEVADADADDAHTLAASSDDSGVATPWTTGGQVKVEAFSRGTATVSVTATDDSGASNAISLPVDAGSGEQRNREGRHGVRDRGGPRPRQAHTGLNSQRRSNRLL